MNTTLTDLFINKFNNILIRRSLLLNANNGYALIGCIIFKRLNNCYTIGYNQYNIGRFNGVYYDNIHAEIDAMNKLKPNYSKKHKRINLFVFRINNLLHLMLNVVLIVLIIFIILLK